MREPAWPARRRRLFRRFDERPLGSILDDKAERRDRLAERIRRRPVLFLTGTFTLGDELFDLARQRNGRLRKAALEEAQDPVEDLERLAQLLESTGILKERRLLLGTEPVDLADEAEDVADRLGAVEIVVHRLEKFAPHVLNELPERFPLGRRGPLAGARLRRRGARGPEPLVDEEAEIPYPLETRLRFLEPLPAEFGAAPEMRREEIETDHLARKLAVDILDGEEVSR
jgi:hypothetical protein